MMRQGKDSPAFRERSVPGTGIRILPTVAAAQYRYTPDS